MAINMGYVPAVELVTCAKGFFDCDPVELARKLLGKYLCFPKSDLGLLRIIETEAYPVDDAVYSKIFGDKETQQALPDEEGVIVPLNSEIHFENNKAAKCPDYLYITAKGRHQETGFKPLVLIRSCMPQWPDDVAVVDKIERELGYTEETSIYHRSNLLINPQMVAVAVAKDFKGEPRSDPVLYQDGGCQLFFRADSFDPVYPLMQGTRVLECNKKFKRGRSYPGVYSEHRFALYIMEKMYDYREPHALALVNHPPVVPQPFIAPSTVAYY